jgi:argininosuccinate lyase
MGFPRVQENPLACMGSRGKDELLCVQAIGNAGITASKLATDLLLFTSEQYDFFSLPDDMLTGSSLMPQKKNYDLLELVRANASILNGSIGEISGVITGLGSGYHRDFQLTKGPMMKGFRRVIQTLQVLNLVALNLNVKTDKLESAITPGSLKTGEVLSLVKQGVPFREAYLRIKDSCPQDSNSKGQAD